MDHRTSLAGPHGFTLVEVLVATGLLVVASVGIAQLLAVGAQRGMSARVQTSATVLAAARMEELRALAWGYQAGGEAPLIERSDTESDLSAETVADGGPGLSASPPGTLTSNKAFHFDFLDANGRWVGNGSLPPPEAAFVRRWAVQPLRGRPDALLLQVLVRPMAQDRGRNIGRWRGRVDQEALLTTVRTRRSQ